MNSLKAILLVMVYSLWAMGTPTKLQYCQWKFCAILKGKPQCTPHQGEHLTAKKFSELFQIAMERGELLAYECWPTLDQAKKDIRKRNEAKP